MNGQRIKRLKRACKTYAYFKYCEDNKRTQLKFEDGKRIEQISDGLLKLVKNKVGFNSALNVIPEFAGAWIRAGVRSEKPNKINRIGENIKSEVN